VKETRAQVGLTHDGDADRVLLCDEAGEIVDGDEIMAISAIDLLASGTLAKNTLVATVHEQLRPRRSVAGEGRKVLRAQVGDRYVIAEMMKGDLNLGGEQSGHMIFRDYTTTGDGIISALQVLRIMVETGKPLSELKKCLSKYPQAQRNLKVKEKPDLSTLPGVNRLIEEARAELAGKGRVFLRYSGHGAENPPPDRRPRRRADQRPRGPHRGVACVLHRRGVAVETSGDSWIEDPRSESAGPASLERVALAGHHRAGSHPGFWTAWR